MRLRALVLTAMAFLALAGSPAWGETPTATPTPAAAPAGLPEDAVSLATASQALALLARPSGATLTWGQDLAAQDLERLARAAEAYEATAKSQEEVSLADLQARVTELQTAATRVHNTVTISVLDAAGQQQAQGLVTQVKGVAEGFARARKAAEAQIAAARSRDDYGPRVSFGFGSYWGYPGWGYPGCGRPAGWGWGAGWSSGGWAPWRRY